MPPSLSWSAAETLATSTESRPAAGRRRHNSLVVVANPSSAPTIISSIWRRILVAIVASRDAELHTLHQCLSVTPRSPVVEFLQKNASFSSRDIYR
jgi:hypothetical protein